MAQGIGELRGGLKASLRGPLLHAFEEWGIDRPDAIELEWDVKSQSIFIYIRWGKIAASQYVDEDYVTPIFINSFVEILAMDANIPIAEPL